MYHPLAPDLSGMSTEELHKKFNDLVSRMNQAYRFGPSSAIQQLQMLQMHYQEEISRRNQKQMEEMQAQMEKRRPGFDKIIDIK
jgi:hypothetical protein